MTGTEHPTPERATGARRRAEERERRGVPELRHLEEREPVRRLGARWTPEPAPRPAPGDRLTVHPDAIRALEPKHPVRPGPNAPLLMRIVRSPYAMQPVKTIRTPVREPRAGREPREALERPGRAWREVIGALASPNPMRAVSHRPEPRPRPLKGRAGDGGEP